MLFNLLSKSIPIGDFENYHGLDDEYSDDEMLEMEKNYWLNYVSRHIPQAYPGIGEIMCRHKAEGGILCVISHSMSQYILRDYRENGLPEPDQIYGWDLPSALRKPDPYAVFEVLKTCSLANAA